MGQLNALGDDLFITYHFMSRFIIFFSFLHNFFYQFYLDDYIFLSHYFLSYCETLLQLFNTHIFMKMFEGIFV